MKILLHDLESEDFAQFGQVIRQPAGSHDASGPGWQYWGELAHLEGGDRPYGIGFLDLQPAPLCFDWAERHMHTDELIVPLGGDCIIYTGPADYMDEPERMPELDRFSAFRIPSGQAVVLKKGVWHGAPLAADRPVKAMVILLSNTSQQDGIVQRFEAAPVDIQTS